jgi:hypothetical protein
MAETGETYQQAQTALSRVVPRHFVMPPADDEPCVGKCQSEFSLAGEAGSDGGSMVACGRCPGSVCVACGCRPVAEPFARCERCEEEVGGWETAERLRERCAGRRCVSRARAGTSDSDSASNICDSCDEAICWCGEEAVEDIFDWCGRCWSSEPDLYDDDQDRRELEEAFHYAAGLIVKLGGGTRRQVYAQLCRSMRVKVGDATVDQLRDGLSHADQWERRLRR